jgi:hypothetical protein
LDNERKLDPVTLNRHKNLFSNLQNFKIMIIVW